MGIQFKQLKDQAQETLGDPRETLVLQTPCLGNLNLLGHVQLEAFQLGSECGGHGVCGKDLVLIDPTLQKQTLNPPTGIEKEKITPKKLIAGWRLSCQAFPQKDDLEIEVFCPILEPQ